MRDKISQLFCLQKNACKNNTADNRGGCTVPEFVCVRRVHTCVYVCLCVCVGVGVMRVRVSAGGAECVRHSLAKAVAKNYTNLHTHTQAHKYIHAHTRTYASTYVCMYACTYVAKIDTPRQIVVYHISRYRYR